GAEPEHRPGELAPGRARRGRHEPLAPTTLPTRVKDLLALAPRAVTALMQTVMIRASMTAYSTAVGPSSRRRKLTSPARMAGSIGCRFLAGGFEEGFRAGRRWAAGWWGDLRGVDHVATQA